MKPILVIDGTDFTDYVLEIKPENDDLDADGSGRDIYTGKMYRTKIADKDKLEISLTRVWEGTMKALRSALNSTYVSVKYLDPGSNTQVARTMYCSSISYGTQAYDKDRGQTYYDDATFSVTER